MSAGEFGNLPRRSTNSTSNIEDPISVIDPDFGGEVVLVAGDGLVEWFTVCEPAEMERLTPTVFVDICTKIVVTIEYQHVPTIAIAGSLLSCEGCVFCFS